MDLELVANNSVQFYFNGNVSFFPIAEISTIGSQVPFA
jgi:hypothetical protein